MATIFLYAMMCQAFACKLSSHLHDYASDIRKGAYVDAKPETILEGLTQLHKDANSTIPDMRIIAYIIHLIRSDIDSDTKAEVCDMLCCHFIYRSKLSKTIIFLSVAIYYLSIESEIMLINSSTSYCDPTRLDFYPTVRPSHKLLIWQYLSYMRFIMLNISER